MILVHIKVELKKDADIHAHTCVHYMFRKDNKKLEKNYYEIKSWKLVTKSCATCYFIEDDNINQQSY